ncbi:hypothetical protein D9M71_731630 [compost metagenome]
MHHGLDVGTQLACQFRVTQVASDELGATAHQMLHTFGPATVDPHVQALLQGETRKAPANEAACAGDQNLHVLLRIFRFAFCICVRREVLTLAVSPTAPAIASTSAPTDR